jgi:hypothetical protein
LNDPLIDAERSACFGEQIPIETERARLRLEGIEHIDQSGKLQVPVDSSLVAAPERHGWEPYFVNFNLSRTPEKWVAYRRPATCR